MEAAREGCANSAVVGGGGRHGLLLCVRSAARLRDRRLSQAHWKGADDAGLGLRAMAVAGALRNRPRQPSGGRGVPPPEDTLRQYRSGLALLARGNLGLARV